MLGMPFEISRPSLADTGRIDRGFSQFHQKLDTVVKTDLEKHSMELQQMVCCIKGLHRSRIR